MEELIGSRILPYTKLFHNSDIVSAVSQFEFFFLMLYISTNQALHLSVFFSVNACIDQIDPDYETLFVVYIM